MFVTRPELLMVGSVGEILLATGSSIAAVVFIASAFAGYLMGYLTLNSRIVMALSGLCLFPSPTEGAVFAVINLPGVSAAGLVLLYQIRQRKNSAGHSV